MMTTFIHIAAVGIPYNAMPVLFSNVTRELQLSLAQIGTIWGALALGVALFSIPGGLLGDRFGFRNVIGIGCIVIALMNGLRGVCNDPVSLTVFMFLCGASIGTVVPSIPKIAGIFFPPDQLGMAIGLINSGFNIGSIIATAFGATAILPLVGSWRNVLFLYGATGVVIGIMWLLILRGASTNTISSEDASVERNVGFRHSLSVVLRVREVWLLVAIGVGLLGSFLALLGYVPIFLENSGVPKSTGDAISSTIFVAGIFGGIFIPALSDRIGKRKVVLAGCTAISGLAIFLLSISGAAFFWLLIPLIGAVSMGAATLCLTIPLEIREIGHVYGASAMGLIIASHNLGGFLLPIAGGYLAEINQTLPFVFWAILVLAVIVCIFPIRETGSKPGR